MKSNVEVSTRNIIAEALVWRRGYWYISGFCYLRGDKRTFRVDRVIKAKRIKQTVQLTGIGEDIKHNGLFN